MSEVAPAPDSLRFPPLQDDPDWVHTITADTMFARVFAAGGPYPSEWNTFRQFGPVDARFDAHPLPQGNSPEHGIMYTVSEHDGGQDTAFTTCLLEVFQRERVIDRSRNAVTLALFETTRPVRLLDLSDSDWLTVAGGNAAVSSGSRARSREWARAIYKQYSDIDGVRSASSVVPNSRISALWSRAADALPAHPTALLRLDRPELSQVLNAVAGRYGYLVL